MTKASCWGVFVLVLVGFRAGAQDLPEAKEHADIAVVVNASNPVDGISLPDLRKMLTGERRFWKGNVQVKVVLRQPGAWERDRVLESLLKLNSDEFSALWSAKVFRGEASDLPLASPSNVLTERFLLRTPGGIAFMDVRHSPLNLKALKIDGKLPREPGYALK